MGQDVFISYSRQDEKVADAVCAALEAAGVRCWIDRRTIVPSERWAAAIARGISECRMMVLVFSDNAVASENVLNEVSLAANRKLPIIPFRIKPVSATGEWEFYLHRTHWMDAVAPLEPHLQRLAAIVRSRLGLSDPPARAEPRPAPAKPAAKTGDLLTNALGMELAFIPPGSFLMGSPEGESGRSDDEAQHKVTLTRGFYLATTPVTQAQWKAVMGTNPSHFKGDDLPAETVSWEKAVEICWNLSQKEGRLYRLPTEAEWEYACRAGTRTAFSFGDEESRPGEYAWHNGNSDGQTHPVGRKKPNAWGLYDMHGNVWEWCADVYGPYFGGEAVNPDGLDATDKFDAPRVLRGGSWYYGPSRCRSAHRAKLPPRSRDDLIGLRVCSEVS